MNINLRTFKKLEDKENQPPHICLFCSTKKIWEATPHSYGIVQPSVLLHGKTVCFSGEGNGHRSYWRTLVESAGGTYVSAVSQSTSILVVPNEQYVSTKTAKAANYGTKIIYYTDFENFLNSA
jgi:NAD-dependent DNA ligase